MSGHNARRVRARAEGFGPGLDDQVAVHEQVAAEATLQAHAVIEQRYRGFALEWDLPEHQLVGQAGLVDRLEQPWPELPMHSYGGVDNCRCGWMARGV